MVGLDAPEVRALRQRIRQFRGAGEPFAALARVLGVAGADALLMPRHPARRHERRIEQYQRLSPALHAWCSATVADTE